MYKFHIKFQELTTIWQESIWEVYYFSLKSKFGYNPERVKCILNLFAGIYILQDI